MQPSWHRPPGPRPGRCAGASSSAAEVVVPPPAASAEARRRRNHELAALMASAAIVGASLALSFPLLSLVLAAAGHDATVIGVNAAAHGLGVLLAAPFFGRLIQRIGAVGAMRLGLGT